MSTETSFRGYYEDMKGLHSGLPLLSDYDLMSRDELLHSVKARHHNLTACLGLAMDAVHEAEDSFRNGWRLLQTQMACATTIDCLMRQVIALHETVDKVKERQAMRPRSVSPVRTGRGQSARGVSPMARRNPSTSPTRYERNGGGGAPRTFAASGARGASAASVSSRQPSSRGPSVQAEPKPTPPMQTPPAHPNAHLMAPSPNMHHRSASLISACSNNTATSIKSTSQAKPQAEIPPIATQKSLQLAMVDMATHADATSRELEAKTKALLKSHEFLNCYNSGCSVSVQTNANTVEPEQSLNARYASPKGTLVSEKRMERAGRLRDPMGPLPPQEEFDAADVDSVPRRQLSVPSAASKRELQKRMDSSPHPLSRLPVAAPSNGAQLDKVKRAPLTSTSVTASTRRGR